MKMTLRSQQLVYPDGLTRWENVFCTETIDAEKTALILCDAWDQHWCRGATKRLNEMVGRLDAFLARMRGAGTLIVHAPSDTMDFYRDSPARRRIRLDCPAEPASVCLPSVFPLPIDDSDGGSDSREGVEMVNRRVWRRQHPAIWMDEERDVISDQGGEIFAYLQEREIRRVFFAGVHTNMCILNRTFGIKNMVRWGMEPVLVRDLTDVMYNPEKAPYVNHEEALNLVVGYIEKFWCPSVASDELIL